MTWREFKFQTGEISEIADELKANRCAEVELDSEDELEGVVEDLAEEGIYKINGADYDFSAVSLEEEPAFYARVKFSTKLGEATVSAKDMMYIDFYVIPEAEEDYDEIFWG